MALHRAEQILAAMQTRLTGLASTGANVFRARPDEMEIPQEQMPALRILMDADRFLSEYSQALVDYELSVRVREHAATNAQGVDTVLNQVRKEVSAAIAADRTLGLSFVLDADEGDSEAPQMDGSGSVVIATQDMHFTVLYRRARNDPSA